MTARAKRRQDVEKPKRDIGPIHIRILRPTDIPACATIVASGPVWRRYGISLRRAHQLLRRAHGRQEGLYVAIADGQVVGFIWFLLRGTFAHSGYIRWIGVTAPARRKGVGTALMAFAETQILRRGPNVFLLVSAFNRLAQRFYRQRGYKLVGRLADYVVPGLTELLYRKTTGPLRP